MIWCHSHRCQSCVSQKLIQKCRLGDKIASADSRSFLDLRDLSCTEVAQGAVQRVSRWGELPFSNWDPTARCLRGAPRGSGSTFTFPRGSGMSAHAARSTATRLAATPHNLGAISVTAEGSLTLISNTTQSQSYQWSRGAATAPQSPGCAAHTHLLSSLITSLVTSCSPFSFFFLFCPPPLPFLYPLLSPPTPSCPVMDIGGVIS